MYEGVEPNIEGHKIVITLFYKTTSSDAGIMGFLQRAAILALQALYSYGNSVRPSVCLSVTVRRRYCVKTTARSTVQFALSDSKMCLVL